MHKKKKRRSRHKRGGSTVRPSGPRGFGRGSSCSLKASYVCWADAVEANKGKQAYLCPYCLHYHLTSCVQK